MRCGGEISAGEISRALPHLGGSGERRIVLSMTAWMPAPTCSCTACTLGSFGTQPGGATVAG